MSEPFPEHCPTWQPGDPNYPDCEDCGRYHAPYTDRRRSFERREADFAAAARLSAHVAAAVEEHKASLHPMTVYEVLEGLAEDWLDEAEV